MPHYLLRLWRFHAQYCVYLTPYPRRLSGLLFNGRISGEFAEVVYWQVWYGYIWTFGGLFAKVWRVRLPAVGIIIGGELPAIGHAARANRWLPVILQRLHKDILGAKIRFYLGALGVNGLDRFADNTVVGQHIGLLLGGVVGNVGGAFVVINARHMYILIARFTVKSKVLMVRPLAREGLVDKNVPRIRAGHFGRGSLARIRRGGDEHPLFRFYHVGLGSQSACGCAGQRGRFVLHDLLARPAR